MMKDTDYPTFKKLNVEKVPAGTISKIWIHITGNGLGMPIRIPVMVARGTAEGPVLGITAAIHGNELNGLSVVQRLFNQIDPTTIRGTIVGIPALNVPGLLLKQRAFNDNVDLNRIMPGREHGNESMVYAARLLDRIIKYFDYMLDLHTASFGRINSYYIRANMNEPVTAEIAMLQNAQIVLNNPGKDGTLRSAAMDLGIPSITLEVGNPNLFQKGMIRSGLTGIFNTMSYLNMIDAPIDEPTEQTIRCSRSYWIYTDRGGVLEVYPGLTDKVKKGEKIAIVRNIFGEIIKTYESPESGIVIGKSVMPIGQTGSRILHLGIPEV